MPASEQLFDLTGMTCANCARAIERGVAKLPGVRSAAVNFAAARLRVVLDPEHPSTPIAIEEKVRALGYRARAAAPAGGGALSEEALRQTVARELRQVLFSGALAVPVAVLHMSGHHHDAGLAAQALLATALQFTIGLSFYAGAWRSLANRSANMDVLVALGTSAAWGFSVAVMAMPASFPGEAVFFETSALLLFFIRLGKFLEALARGRTSEALRGLATLAPQTAHRFGPDGALAEVPAALLEPGDRLSVRPGEKIPTDGLLEQGVTAVDESLVTGESAPVEKTAGSPLIGGTLNQGGVVVMRATRVGSDTMLAQVVRLVEDALSKRAPIERFADRVSAVFVPSVVGLALLTFAAWYWLFPVAGRDPFLFAVTAATAVLVIACPCALGLATPTAILVGSGVGLARGILFKNPAALERMARLDTLLFDKTGTLTVGRPRVVSVVAAAGLDERRVLELAAAAETASNHPLARAIVEHAAALGLPAASAVAGREEAGLGVTGSFEGKPLLAGSPRHLAAAGVGAGPLEAALGREAELGRTPVLVAWDGAIAGVVSLADPLKPGVQAVLARVRALGLRVEMLTGDQQPVAAAIARDAGITDFQAGLLPAGKLQRLTELQAAGRVVAMVGDGINDAAVLAQADVGIAIGSGADVAREAGEIVLVKDNLMDVARAIELGRATLRSVKQNLVLSLAYNALGLPLAAGALYPLTGRLLPPEFAGLAMALSSVSVVGNALRLKRVAAKIE